MIDVILKRFETPDEIRHFEKGRFELVTLGATRCHMEHVGTVLSGHATATFDDGRAALPARPGLRRRPRHARFRSRSRLRHAPGGARSAATAR